MHHYRPDQAAEILQMSKRTIYRAIEEGILEKVIVRGRVKVFLPLEVYELHSRGENLMRPKALAEIFSIHPSSIYRWFHEGQLDGVIVGRDTIRILESSAKSFAEAKGYEWSLK